MGVPSLPGGPTDLFHETGADQLRPSTTPSPMRRTNLRSPQIADPTGASLRVCASLPTMETNQPVPRAILVGIQLDSVDEVAHEASLKELGRLVETLGYEVAGSVSQKRDGIGGLTVLGKGKLAELAAITGGTGVVRGWTAPQKSKARARFENAEATKPDVPALEPQSDASRPEFIIVDHEISPSQARNLENATGVQVLDRTSVILEIFHRHAHSREAKLQVEMARLKYVAPRLRESASGGERKRGVGAGASDLDLDRRNIRDRLAHIAAGIPAFRYGEKPSHFC